ncbi:MAG TPA: hypothetical protein VKD72_24560, partial [Gemmataceae bacterium]|nr:hypothetical protein [Gemmataceae bacterium]
MQRILSLTLLALATSAGLSVAQEAPQDEELTFVRQLRERGLADLALEYLDKRLRNNPKYAADLPLEIASTRLEMATAEPDPGKRAALFAQTRTELDAFLQKNAAHPRANDARFQIAQIAVLQGKTQLTRALALPENDDTRGSELAKARSLLIEARKELKATADRINTDQARNKADAELGLLLMAQARTYVTDEEIKEQDKVLKEARDILDKVSLRLEDKDPLRWIALAWIGRARSIGGEPKEATLAFNQVLGSSATAASAGKRLARYFILLAEFEKPDSQDKPNTVAANLNSAVDWIKAYSAYRNTPEGQGVQYILARQYFNRGVLVPAERNTVWPYARQYASALEQTDNEFTIRAQEIKIEILVQEKAFTRALNTLVTFDDCYMRALYEQYQLFKDKDKKFDTEEKQRKQRQAITAALERALQRAQGKEKSIPAVDLANARFLLIGFYFSQKKYEDAARVGEEFIRATPRARQASVAALHTAEALGRVIKDGAGDDVGAMKEERKRLYELGKYMAERWPGDRAGTYGQFLVADYLLKKPLEGKTRQEQEAERQANEKQALAAAGDYARLTIGRERARQGEHLQAVRLLKEIKPDFIGYPTVLYRLALAALEVEKNNVLKKRNREPVDVLSPDDQRSFREIAVEALEKVPTPEAGADPETNQVFLQSKIQLIRVYHPLHRYQQMLDLIKKLEGMLGDLRLPSSVKRDDFRPALNKLRAYALCGLADAADREGRYTDVATHLGPLIKDLSEDKLPELKEDASLLNGLLGLALRGNIQSQQLTQAREVLEVWKKVDKNPETAAKIIKQTIVNFHKQVEELRKTGNKEKLNKTVDGFDSFLDLVAKDDKDRKTDFTLLMAQGYLGIGKYAKAAKLLEKARPPSPKGNAKDREESLRRVLRVLLVRA